MPRSMRRALERIANGNSTAAIIGSHAIGSDEVRETAARADNRRPYSPTTADHAASSACSGVRSPETTAPIASWSCCEIVG